MKTIAVYVLALAVLPSVADAQLPYVGMSGNYGFGGYGGYGPYGGSGFGPYAGYGSWYGQYGYGPLNYSQQLFQQQASQTQQIFQQQQQATIGQIRERQGTLERLDAAKQQLFQQYLSMSDSDKAAVRVRLMNDYLNLDTHGKEGWQRDAVVQSIIGQDLQRLDGLAEMRNMSQPDRIRFRQAMLQRYRSLSPAEQQAWQNDQIVGSALGKDWWLK